MRKPFIAGNWKMNKTVDEAYDLAIELVTGLRFVRDIDVALCPPFVSLTAVKSAIANTMLKLGAQNMHDQDRGAFTGEISPVMLKDLVEYVILGHSERRQHFGESDAFINRKVHAALRHGLHPILCIGETLEQNERGETESVLARQTREGLAGVSADQVASVVIAYEPVWAIGTGRAATAEDAQQRCAFIRQELRAMFGEVADAVRIQYGGSVTPANAPELLCQPDIDGALVGGASLKSEDFIAIVRAAHP
ncbi:MAG: triose-phosphate isomerase [Anaerolineae bacterium]|nr:triose-phosphate isomerase [Thermoflexales bacterium]MDW8394788.1 triose-phosphate isomerase [Anaerolineae bacterium]